MRYIEAPEEYTYEEHKYLRSESERLFLAGGITGTQNWQNKVVEELQDIENLVVFNPRRENFPIDDPEAAFFQIRWEFEHFQKSTMILFWFPPETLCPIALYELGRWTLPNTSPYPRPELFLGTDPNYKRRQDIEIQTSLARPATYVHKSLDDLIGSVRTHLTGIEVSGDNEAT